MKENTLRNNSNIFRNLLIYGGGVFGSKIISFLLIPIYSFYMSKSEFGYFDIVLSVVSILVPIFTLQLSDSVYRWLLKDKNIEQNSLIISTAILAHFIVVCIVLIFTIPIYVFFEINYLNLIVLYLISSIIHPLFQQISRGQLNNILFAINGLLYAFLYVIFNILFLVMLSLKLEGVFISLILCNVLATVHLCVKLKILKYLKFDNFSRVLFLEQIKYSSSLIPNSLSWWGINAANKFLIIFFLGLNANGIFAMSSRFTLILVMINQIFTLSWQDTLINNHENNNAEAVEINKVFINLIKIQFVIVSLLSLLSRPVISLFMNNEFDEIYNYLPILFLGSAFLTFSSYFGAFYLTNFKTKKLFTSTIYGAIINLLFTLLTINFLGLFSVAIGTLLGFLYLFIYRFLNLRKEFLLEFPYTVFLKYLILIILSTIISYININILTLISILILIFFVIKDNREILIKYFYFIKKRLWQKNS